MRNKNLIGISGKLGSGKDTVANFIRELTEPYMVRRFADAIKDITCKTTGIQRYQLENREFKESKIGDAWGELTYREFMQRLGTECGRSIHKDMWVNSLMVKYKDNLKWIIPDVRFPNELRAIKQEGGITIRVERPGKQEFEHQSETALDNARFDYTIINDGSLEDLEIETRIIIRKEGLMKK